jgi:ubiquitin-protein ligase
MNYENNLRNYKRLIKELENSNFRFKLIVDNYNIIILKLNIVLDNYKFNLDIYYPDDYPFRPPNNYLINDIPCIKYFKKINKNLTNYINDCICCNSHTCSYNWTPSLKYTHIIDESIQIIKKNRIIVYFKYLSKIINKYTDQTMNYLYDFIYNYYIISSHLPLQ